MYDSISLFNSKFLNQNLGKVLYMFIVPKLYMDETTDDKIGNPGKCKLCMLPYCLLLSQFYKVTKLTINKVENLLSIRLC